MYTLIFSIVAIFTFCERTDAADVAKRNEGCELQTCMDHLYNFQNGYVSSVSGEQYVQLCQANDNFQSCFGDKIELCNDDSEKAALAGTADILNYFCSDEGRGDFEQIADSPCVTEQTTLTAVQDSVGQCMETFEKAVLDSMLAGGDAQLVDFCMLIEQVIGCIMSSLTNQCGQDFGTFAEKMWEETLKPHVVRMGCDIQIRHIRHLKTRLFPLVLAVAKRRS